MKQKFFSGNSLDQVVMKAARHYELEPSELAYRQIEKKHGFLRTRKAVMIAVDPENPRRRPPAAAGDGRSAGPEPQAPAAAVAREGDGERDAAALQDDDERRPEAWSEDDDPGEDEPWEVDDDEDEPWEEEDDGDDPWEDDDEDDESAAEAGEVAAAERSELRPERRDPEPAARRPAYREAEPRDVTGDTELLEAAERGCRLLLAFAGIDASPSATAAGERIEVEIEGPDESVLVVESGKGLLSIQHLLPRMLRGMTGRSSFVRVDSEDFHRRRRERLEALALKEAEKASRDRRPRTLPPMAPDERRIVHLALKDSPTVVTESRGTGLHKRVVIRPADSFDEPGDVEARHGF